MNFRTRLLLLLVLVLTLGMPVVAQGGIGNNSASSPHPATAVTPWTFMVYLNGDNDLDRWTDDLFNRLELAADNPNVHILVLWDRHPGGMWDPGTCLYEVQYDANVGRLFAYEEDVNRWCPGELNMGDRQTLADLVTWARDNYPAEHYFLSVFDHGGGWAPELPPLQPPPVHAWLEGGFGLSWDDTDLDYLSTYDLGWALDSAAPLDVVLYDACLMAMLENAYEVRDDVDFLIASQSLALATLPYDYYVNAITATTTPAGLATDIAQLYLDSLPPNFGGSISVLRLDRAADVAAATDELAWALSALLTQPNAREQIANAYLDAQKLDYDSDLALEPERDGFVDLYDFAQQVMVHLTDTQAIVAAVQVVSTLDDGFVLFEGHRDGYPYTGTLAGLHGASIYLPFGEELYVGQGCLSMTLDICEQQLDHECIQLRPFYTTTIPPQERQLRLAQGTHWDEFIDDFIAQYYPCSGQLQAKEPQLNMPNSTLHGHTPSAKCESYLLLSPKGRPAGVLPAERPIHILYAANQRPIEIPPGYDIYLPLARHGFFTD